MSAVLELPIANQQAAEETLDLICHCDACESDVIPEVQGLQRVELPPAGELVDALMATRDFVLDPKTPKVRHRLAVREFDHPSIGAAYQDTRPCDEETTHWCAIGFFGKTLGIDDAGALCDTIAAHYYAPIVSQIWTRFDHSDYEGSAHAIEKLARTIQLAGQ